MDKKSIVLGFCLMAIAASATAQVTGSGTAGTVPVFTGTSAIGNSGSPIVVNSSGNVGIGGISTSTTVSWNPLNMLTPLGGGGVGVVGLVDPTEGNYTWSELSLWINNPSAPTPMKGLWNLGNEAYYSASGVISNQDMYVYDSAHGVYNLTVDGSDNVYIGGYAYPYGGSPVMYAGVSGKVGIGTTSPAQPLEVNGNAQVDGSITGSGGGAVSVGASGITFPSGGGTQTTAWTGVLCGGDYAEDMRAANDKKSYAPGDVLVLSSDDNSDIQKSTEPYSTMVAGIYATKPGVVGLRDAVSKSTDNVPMAMVGVVPTKVTAENGSIHKGDLLVTSSKMGYAMKGSDRSKMLGAVLGKAMGNLDTGIGVIEVLVTLQ